ncbi:MAG TPA: lamin tail domain-containing protein, partial [Actinomycetes bacterium]|nr:lamin tail domain-containing protein [Actinomycetes bacterium]
MPLTRVATPRRLAALLVAPLLLLPLVLATPAAAVSPDLVISQVYGGGGNSGATYTHDFIEIYNRGSAPASLAGKSVQYASSTGSTWQTTALTGTLGPGRYYLVQEAAGTG